MVLDRHADSAALPDQLDLDRWLELYVRFEGGTKGNQRYHRAIIDRIETPICLAVRRDGDDPVAVGLAVVDGPWVGLFDIAADPARRRRGHGRALVEGLVAWGLGRGAERAFLNVSADNAPAVALYEQLGFREAYRYWYWVEPRR
jgi:ribosomal protein S18 acetylase RimI-like enzyme